jgi:hypothetical protein
MKPSEVRTRILSDHERLRADLDRLEVLVRDLRGGRAASGTLRLHAAALVARLQAHMRWEEFYLLPALRDADAWGEQRAERLVSDHRQQRELFDFLNARLCDDAQPAALVARDVAHLVSLLRDDMREEEAELLDEHVLRDDVVAIAVQTG